MTNEELYLTGLHIEQYRHATYLPDPYYLEGAGGPGRYADQRRLWASAHAEGLFGGRRSIFRRAVERATWKNPNPYNSAPYYNLGFEPVVSGAG